MPLIVVVWLIAMASGPTGQAPVCSDATVAAVRDLYTSASYQEALDMVVRIDGSDAPPVLYEYRALCLLALGRQQEAAAAFATLVERDPLFQPDPASLSPSVRQMFEAARRRTLPDVVEKHYRRGRAAFESGDYQVAADEFRVVGRLVETIDVVERGASLGEINVLAEGFGRLAAEKLERPATRPGSGLTPSPTPTSVAAGQPAAVPAPAVVTPPLIVPPVAVSRRLPPWPDKLLVPLRAFATMELVIDTSGAVITARILESAHPVYDEMLVGVASTWRYRPATRNGRPIAYTMAQRIDLPR